MLDHLYTVLRDRFRSVFSGVSNAENVFVSGRPVTDFSYLNKVEQRENR